MPTETPIRSRTLVVDDDEVMRELLAALLDLQGHDVHAVASGEAALQWLEEAPAPNLILTDMHMPGMEGLVLVEALREVMVPPTRLLGMSGSQPQAPVLHSLDAFVLKPFGYADLATALQELDAAEGMAASEASSMARIDSANPTAEMHEMSAFALSSGELQSYGRVQNSDTARSSAEPVLDAAIFDSLSKSFRMPQLAELYTLTLNDVAVRQTRMEGHAEAGDREAAQREAHSMKGLCGMVGAREIGALAAAVEAGTTLDISALHEIPAACARLRRMLDTKFASH